MAILLHEHQSAAARIEAGVITGLIGGFFMALFSMMFHLIVTGQGVFAMPNSIAMLAGYAFHTDFGVYTALGLIMHLAYASILGLVWGLLFSRTPSVPAAFFGGLIYGLLLYWLMLHVVLPMVDPQMAITAQNAFMLVSHLVYGAAFAIYPTLADRFSRR